MNSIRAVFLLVLAAEAQYTTGPCGPQEGAVDVCCDSKKVGDYTYTKVSTGKVPHECMSDCIYTRDDKPGSRFCFAKGADEVMCLAGCTEGLTQCGPHGGQFRPNGNTIGGQISFNDCNYWKAFAAPDGGVVGWNISVWTPPDYYPYGTTETYVQGFRMYYGHNTTRPGEPALWHGSFAYTNNDQPIPPDQGTVEYSRVELPVGDFITGVTGWTVERPGADHWYDISVVGGLSFITNNGTLYKYGSTAVDCTLANYTTRVFACADNTNKCGLKYVSGRTGTEQGITFNGVGGFLDQLSFWFDC